MITPTQITNYNRTRKELEAFYLFALFVGGGKNSDYAARCLNKMFLKSFEKTPFEILRDLGETGIHNILVVNKVGQYTRLTRAIMQSLDLDLENCTINELLKIHGVGNKTARFFILHTRPNQHMAVLDTHILAWMREHGCENAPKSTPTDNAVYQKLECHFLVLRQTFYPHLNPADADLLIWTSQSGRLESDTKTPEFPCTV